MKSADVLVVGAGIVGLTTAWALLQAGRHPLVLDAGEPGRESSWAGGGIVCPVPPWRYPPAVNALVARSRELFPDWIADWQRLSGVDCEYLRSGLLLLGELYEQGRDWLAEHWPTHQAGCAADFEAGLRPADAPAALLPEIPQVRNPRLCRALVLALQARGVSVLGACPVERIELDDARLLGVRLGGGERLACAELVLAAGAWTDAVLASSGLPGLGIHPVRGQMLLFRPQAARLRHIVNHGQGYLIPRRDGRILAGSSVEHVGFDCHPQRDFYARTLAMAQSCLPGLQESDLECHWLGFRPGSEAELPLISGYADVPGLWLNAGHYRNGLGMAPAAAELLVARMQARGC